MNELNTQSTPREIFMQLLSIITLYLSVFSVLSLLFQFIDLRFNGSSYSSTFFASSIRYYLALLIVGYPLYLYSMIKYRSWAQQNPGLNSVYIKTWLTYFTLFLATLCIFSDLAILIYHFLNGELSISFILKVVSLLMVSALVFYYYQRDLKQSFETLQLRFFAMGISLLVFAVMVYGFLIAGSPLTARLASFDNQRVVDLNNIQLRVMSYWKINHKLPANLTVLNTNINGYQVPNDPENHTAYNYTVLSTSSFQLCAQFNLASTDQNPNNLLQQNANWNWQHDAGEVCFARNLN